MSTETVETQTNPEAPAPTAEAPSEQHEHPHQHAPAFNPDVTRSVEVTIPADEVSRATRHAVRRYQRQARIPGFRAGKVPESLIRSRFADSLRQEVLEAVMPAHFQNAIAQGGFRLVSQPQVVDMKMEEGQPLWFRAEFEVMPEFSVDGYQEVKVPKPDPTFGEQDFQAELARVRDSRSTMEPVEEDRPLADGDWAQIRFTGHFVENGEVAAGPDGQDADKQDADKQDADKPGPLTGEDVLVEVGGEQTLAGFTEALRGARPGQELRFELTYPEDFGEKRLAGRTVAYDLTVMGIKRRVQPELNDEFARELGDYTSYQEFESKFRENLQAEKNHRTEAETREALMNALAERFQFPVPESLVQQQIDARLERGLRALAAQGMREEDMKRLDFARLRAAQRDAATGEVKALLVLDRIADAEQVGVSDEEVEQELQMLSLRLREPLDALRVRLTQDGSLARIREQIRRDKTAALLYERL